jgi:hypothetical protein
VIRRKFHIYFRLALVRGMLARVGHEPWPARPAGRPALVSRNIGRLDTSDNKHCQGRGMKRRCPVCSARGMTGRVKSKCVWYHTVRRTKLLRGLPQNRMPLKHLFVHSPYKQWTKMWVQETGYLQILETFLHYTMRIFTAL